MSDPAIARAVEVKQYADRLENEVTRELRLFENAERMVSEIQSNLRSMTARLVSAFDGVNKERDRQKVWVSSH